MLRRCVTVRCAMHALFSCSFICCGCDNKLKARENKCSYYYFCEYIMISSRNTKIQCYTYLFRSNRIECPMRALRSARCCLQIANSTTMTSTTNVRRSVVVVSLSLSLSLCLVSLCLERWVSFCSLTHSISSIVEHRSAVVSRDSGKALCAGLCYCLGNFDSTTA